MSKRIHQSDPFSNELRLLFEAVARDLAGWLHGQFLRHGGRNWWERHIISALNERDQGNVDRGQWEELEDLDLSPLLWVMTRNFRFLRARGALADEHRDTVRSMRDARNRCVGHWPVKGHRLDEFPRHLDAIQSFWELIGGTGVIEKVGTARRSLTRLVAETPSAAEGSYDETDQPFIRQNEPKLADHFGGMKLTPSQKEAVQALQQFFESPDQQCFVLKGYAGTGKTFMIGGLVRYLESINRVAKMMAPTGRAAHVISERHKVKASTIHRSIYSLTGLKEYRELDENGDITYKFYFETRNNDLEHDTVFIVDEASMLSDLYSEAEFMHFGSGRLLSDLLQHINFDSNDYRKKLILVGDDAQLPPPKMKLSPALDIGHLEQKCFIRCAQAELTDVVRQKESSLVLDNATKMRDLIRNGKHTAYDFQTDGSSVRELEPAQFIEAFTNQDEPLEPSRSVIVTDTNAKAKAYNDAVRERLFPGSGPIQKGDRVIVVRNNYRHERIMLNGQMAVITDCAEKTEVRNIPVNTGRDASGNRQTESIRLEFRRVTLRFADAENQSFEVSCMIYEECLKNPNADIPSIHSKALYVDFQKRHPGLRPKQPEFREALKADPYFNAVMIKYGYAITCHKAQGGEWDTVFVDFSGKNKLDRHCLQWSYTALTRATSSLVATNALHHDMLTPIKGITGLSSAGSVPASAPDGNKTPTPVSRPAGTAEAVHELVARLLPDGWKIAGQRSTQYQEKVTLETEGKRVDVLVSYKSNHRVSRVRVVSMGDRALEEQAHELLSPLMGYTLLGHEATETLNEDHAAFVDELRVRLEPLGVEIVSLRSNTEYQLAARLRAGIVEGSVNYHFNASRTFRKCQPQDDCPPEIRNIISQIHQTNA